MANLGSDNTPVEGESFGLPSGYSFDEEGGDLVIRDTDGTVAMRRADGTAWQLEGSDISGVGAFDSELVDTEQLQNAEFASPDGKTISQAISDAGEGGYVIVREGSYDEEPALLDGVTVEGWGDVVITQAVEFDDETISYTFHSITWDGSDSDRMVRSFGSDVEFHDCTIINRASEVGDSAFTPEFDEGKVIGCTTKVPNDDTQRSMNVRGSDITVTGNVVENTLNLAAASENIEEAGNVIV